MNTELFYITVYLIFGLLFSTYHWNHDYAYEYVGNQVSDGMAIFYMTIVMIFWPIWLIRGISKSIIKFFK